MKTTVNRGADAGFTQRARAGVDPERSAPAGTSGGDAERLSAPLRQDKETLALVKQINAARSESYQQLADDNNLPVDEVAKMAGQKLVARAQPGEYVQGLNGQWLRK